ncbi:MAG: hypothetical protein ABIA97_03680 [Candidatus Omnitrophota bacterium]
MMRIGKGLKVNIVLIFMIIGVFLYSNLAYALRPTLPFSKTAKEFDLVNRLSSDDTEEIDDALIDLYEIHDSEGIVSIIEKVFANRGLKFRNIPPSDIEIETIDGDERVGFRECYTVGREKVLWSHEVEIGKEYRHKRLFPLLYFWMSAHKHFKVFSGWEIRSDSLTTSSSARALWRSPFDIEIKFYKPEEGMDFDEEDVESKRNTVVKNIKEIEDGWYYKIEGTFLTWEDVIKRAKKQRLLEISRIDAMEGKIGYLNDVSNRVETFEIDIGRPIKTTLILRDDGLVFCDVFIDTFVINNDVKEDDVMFSIAPFNDCVGCVLKGDKDGKTIIIYVHPSPSLGNLEDVLRKIFNKVEELKLDNLHVVFDVEDEKKEKMDNIINNSDLLENFSTILEARQNGKILINGSGRVSDRATLIIATKEGIVISDETGHHVFLWDEIKDINKSGGLKDFLLNKTMQVYL